MEEKGLDHVTGLGHVTEHSSLTVEEKGFNHVTGLGHVTEYSFLTEKEKFLL